MPARNIAWVAEDDRGDPVGIGGTRRLAVKDAMAKFPRFRDATEADFNFHSCKTPQEVAAAKVRIDPSQDAGVDVQAPPLHVAVKFIFNVVADGDDAWQVRFRTKLVGVIRRSNDSNGGERYRVDGLAERSFVSLQGAVDALGRASLVKYMGE